MYRWAELINKENKYWWDCCSYFYKPASYRLMDAGINDLIEEGISKDNFFSSEENAFEEARSRHPKTSITILTLELLPSVQQNINVKFQLTDVKRVISLKSSTEDYKDHMELPVVGKKMRMM